MKKLITILLFLLICVCVYAQDIKPAFILETGKPGNLFYFGETLKGKIVVNDSEIKKVKGTIDFYDSYGKQFKSKKVEFNTSYDINLPNKKGCVEIKYNFIVNDKDNLKGTLSYGTIPNNIKIMGGMKSYFGANTHFNQVWDPSIGKIVKRVGISWIRDGEAFTTNERALPVAKENGLKYMPCFTNAMREASFDLVKEGIANGKSAEGTWEFGSALDCVREYIDKYGNDIDFYNVMNEQNYSGWRELGGEEYYGPWQNIFIQWAKQVSDIIREKDPTAKIVWDDANFSALDIYAKYGIDKEIDYISIHPYNSKPEGTLRLYNFNINNTEDIYVNSLYNRFKKFKKDNNRNWGVMEGENGFPSYVKGPDDPTGYASRTSDMQAAHLVRMYIMHLSCGAERIIWYDFKDDGTDSGMAEQNFGLVKYDGSPKPSVCAMANLINQIEGGKIKRRNSDYKNYSYVYEFTNRKGLKGIVCWTEPTPMFHGYKGYVISKTDYSNDIEIETNSKYVKKVDMFGNESNVNVIDGKIKVTLSEYPVYILGL